ncbi:MAG: hypothetical protein M5U26_08050 [Planctomycetota bacterium]|nr:hypothetical protein [Planctomycetota bacterium]
MRRLVGGLLMWYCAAGALGGESVPPAEKACEAALAAARQAEQQANWTLCEALCRAALKAAQEGKIEIPLDASLLLAKAQKRAQEALDGRLELRAGQRYLELGRGEEAYQALLRAKQLGAEPKEVEDGLRKAREILDGAAAPAPPAENRYLAKLQEGRAMLDRRDWRAAELAFLAALAERPGDEQAKAGLAQAREGAKPPEPAPPEPVRLAESPLPVPAALAREDWKPSGGSFGQFTGRQYVVNENQSDDGEAKYAKALSGDFRVSVLVVAQMDYNAKFHLDLRPEKEQRDKIPTLEGWASEKGSPPKLTLLDRSGRKEAGSGAARLQATAFVLSFRRLGERISFYVDGQKIGETLAVPKDATLYLYAGGRGAMQGIKVETGP